MGIDTTQLSTDLGFVINDLPTIAQFAGVTVSGVFTDLTVGKGLESGGFLSDFDAKFIALQSSFITTPASGMTLGISTQTLRILEVVKDPSGAGLEIHLISPDK